MSSSQSHILSFFLFVCLFVCWLYCSPSQAGGIGCGIYATNNPGTVRGLTTPLGGSRSLTSALSPSPLLLSLLPHTEACHYIADNCDANIIIAENKQQVAKVLKVSTYTCIEMEPLSAHSKLDDHSISPTIVKECLMVDWVVFWGSICVLLC